jgi:hypothetical protein
VVEHARAVTAGEPHELVRAVDAAAQEVRGLRRACQQAEPDGQRRGTAPPPLADVR